MKKPAFVTSVLLAVVVLLLRVSPCSATTFYETFSSGWHLISLPCEPENADDLSAVFSSSFEEVYGIVDGKYVYYTDMDSVSAGMAFWVHFASETQVTISGSTLGTAELDTPLTPGWNMVGTPYSVSKWSETEIAGTLVGETTLDESPLYQYDSKLKKYVETNMLLPWRGYFVKIGGDTAVQMTVPNGGTIADPDQPTSVVAKECPHGQFTKMCVTWDPPVNPGNGYNVYVYHPTEDFDLPYNMVMIRNEFFIIGQLTPGEEYGIEVTSVIDNNGLLLGESQHSSRALDSTLANAGNETIITFLAKSDITRSSYRAAARSVYDLGDGYDFVASATVKVINYENIVVATATSDSYGWVEVSGLPPGTYSVDVIHEMDANDKTDDIARHVTGIDTSTQSVRHLDDQVLEEAGRIQGTVTLAGETNHEFIDVGIPGTSFWAKTDAQGSYTIYYIPPGKWDLAAYKAGYTTARLYNVEVESKQTTTATAMQLTVLPDTGSISGQIELSGETNHSGISVKIQPENPFLNPVIVLTNTSGVFSQGMVPPGTITLTASHDGFFDFSAQAVVTGGAETDLRATIGVQYLQPTDETLVKRVAQDMTKAYLERNIENLQALVSSDFLESGENASQAMASTQDDWAEYSTESAVLSDFFVEIHGNYASATYLSTWSGTYTSGRTEGGTEYSYDNFVKENGEWKYWGDRRKVDLQWLVFAAKDINTHNLIVYAIWASIEEAAAYPVGSATISGTKLVNSPLSFSKTGERWNIDGNRDLSGIEIGDKYYLTVNFTGGGSDIYILEVLALPPEIVVQFPTDPLIIYDYYDSLYYKSYYMPIPFDYTNVTISNTITGDTASAGSWFMNFGPYQSWDQPLGTNNFLVPTSELPPGGQNTMDVNFNVNGLHYNVGTIYGWKAIYLNEAETAVANAVNGFETAYDNKDAVTFESYMATDLLDCGLNKTELMAGVQDEWLQYSESNDWNILEISVSGNYATATVKEHWSGTDMESGQSYEETEIYYYNMIKEGADWKFWGDRRKVDLGWSVQNQEFDPGSGNWSSHLQVWIEEAANYPVSSVSVSGGQLALGSVGLNESATDTWSINWEDNTINGITIDDTYTVSVTFEDMSTDDYTLTVMEYPPNVTTSFTTTPSIVGGRMTIPSGTQEVVVSYSITNNDTRESCCWSLNIGNASSGYNTEWQPFSSTTVRIPTDYMPTGVENIMYANFQTKTLNETSFTVYTWEVVKEP